MSRFRRVRRRALRGLLSDMLPYEVTLPFGNISLYRFLRRLKFEWVDRNHFRVSTQRLGKAEEVVLKLIFDRKHPQRRSDQNGFTTFEIHIGKGPAFTLHPYRFVARRNNGKMRNLVIPHPQSMLEMARFLDDFADSILYFTNRSAYSIRHPTRIARVEVRHDRLYEQHRDDEEFDLEQHDLEYDHVTSYFSYKKYNNIHRFYSSAEFRACERKYPILVRADITKCFDSIYTHTVSWVTNGRGRSKAGETRDLTKQTFGGLFDAHLQALNYGETSGIVIGPEFSRVFAEVILQEIDVRVERELEALELLHGVDYEIRRYVDDYFIFLSSPADADRIEEVLAKHLDHFKLHLNDSKQEVLSTPLQSHLSVAKYRIYYDLKRLTICNFDADANGGLPELGFAADKAILEYKAALLDAEQEHGDLANFYLYSLTRRMDKTFRKYRKYDNGLHDHQDAARRRQSATLLARYAVAVVDVAFFIYAGAPSASHSIKLARIVVGVVRELEHAGLSYAELASVKDKVCRELMAQLVAVRDEKTFGIHTLNLLDCLVYLEADLTSEDLTNMLKRRHVDLATLDSLDALAILTLLRACGRARDAADLKTRLIERARTIVDAGEEDRDYEAQRVILRLSLPTCPVLTAKEVRAATDISKAQAEILRGADCPSLFAWDADEHYYQRLLLKSARSVY